MTKATYGEKKFVTYSFRRLEYMTIMMGSMAAGRQDTGAVFESLCFETAVTGLREGDEEWHGLLKPQRLSQVTYIH